MEIKRVNVKIGDSIFFKNSAIFLLFVLFLLPDFLYLVISNQEPAIDKIAYFMMSLSISILPFLALKNRLKTLSIGVFVLTLFFGVLSVGIIIFYDSKLTVNTLANILNTTPQESDEFMSGMKYESVVFLLLLILIFVFIYKNISNRINEKNIRTLSVVCIGGVLLSTSYFIVVKKQTVRLFLKSNVYKEYYPIYCFKALSTYYREGLKLAENLKIAEKVSFNAKEEHVSEEQKVFILVIGESSRYANWSINGYKQPTSPNLEKDSNVISFSNVISSHNSTIKSVALMVTPCGANNYDQHSANRSILKLFGEVKYKTYWISNQNDWGAAPIKIHMTDADSVYCTNGTKGVTKEYDEKLLPVIKNILKQKQDLFVVIHLTGNHWNYEDRYPATFSKYGHHRRKFERENNYFDVSNKADIIDTYNNSIAYQDSIIGECLKLLNSEKRIGGLIYTSDHGENLFDDARNLTGHGASFSEATFRIPLFIYTNEEFNVRNKEKVDALRANRNSSIVANESVFYTLADLAGISFKQDNDLLSLCSVNYQSQRNRAIILPDNSISSYEKELIKEQLEIAKASK